MLDDMTAADRQLCLGFISMLSGLLEGMPQPCGASSPSWKSWRRALAPGFSVMASVASC